jgi:general secretion pathway protein A
VISDLQQSVIEDLDSTNGVYVKSKRVKRHELVDGDVIQIGEHKLLYRDLRSSTLVVAEDLHDDRDDEVEEALEDEQDE